MLLKRLQGDRPHGTCILPDQFENLEPAAEDEVDGITVDSTQPLEVVKAAVLDKVQRTMGWIAGVENTEPMQLVPEARPPSIENSLSLVCS